MAKRRKPVQVLIKPASADCNMACRYCFYLEKASLYPQTPTHRMPLEVQERLVRELMREGGETPAFAYQGGEPTLMGLDFFKRGVDLQKFYGRPGQHVANSIQTNGLLVDEEWAAFLGEYRFLVGLSLDGPPDVHDRWRLDRGGRPTHARVLEAARVMEEYGVEFNILCVLSRASVGRGREIYRWFRDRGFAWMQFIPAVEYDPETGALADFCIGPEDYADFMCEVYDAWREDFDGGRPTSSVRLFESLVASHCGMQPPNCSYMRRCGIYVVIEHNGDVYACDFFVEPEWKLGNLMERPLRALFESPLQARFGARKADLPPECETCEHLALCWGGCPKDRMRAGRKGELGLNYFCPSYRRLFAYTAPGMKELAARVRAERAAAPSAPAKARRRGRGK